MFVISSKLSKASTSKNIDSALTGIVAKQNIKKYPEDSKGLSNIIQNGNPEVVLLHEVSENVAKKLIQSVAVLLPNLKFLHVGDDWSAARKLLEDHLKVA